MVHTCAGQQEPGKVDITLCPPHRSTNGAVKLQHGSRSLPRGARHAVRGDGEGSGVVLWWLALTIVSAFSMSTSNLRQNYYY